MNIEVLDQPPQQLVDFLKAQISQFNWAHWEVGERLPLAVQIKNTSGEVIAGASGRSFGDWLLLDYLWVSESLRGQNLGSRLLLQFEAAGKERGCDKCLLDTLNFQAMPFYQKHGYVTQWVQQGYPKHGCKYYMVKLL